MKTNLIGRRRLRTNTKPVNSFNHDELEVAQIMLSLPDLIPEFDNRNKENIPPEISRWRCKRQRSAIDYDNHDHVRIILPPPPSSLPSLEKPKFRSLKKKKDPKKSRKELEEQLDELTERKKVFLLNIERARIFYEEQKALNFRLKEFIKSNDELQSFVNRRLNLVRQENDDDHDDAKEEDDDDDDRYNDEESDEAEEEEEEEENVNDANDDG